MWSRGELCNHKILTLVCCPDEIGEMGWDGFEGDVSLNITLILVQLIFGQSILTFDKSSGVLGTRWSNTDGCRENKNWSFHDAEIPFTKQQRANVLWRQDYGVWWGVHLMVRGWVPPLETKSPHSFTHITMNTGGHNTDITSPTTQHMVNLPRPLTRDLGAGLRSTAGRLRDAFILGLFWMMLTTVASCISWASLCCCILILLKA